MSPRPQTRTILYVRVSSMAQAEAGLSLEAQEAKGRAYAGLYDLTLVEVIVDAGESAKNLKRPGIQRALGMLRSGEATALLVCKLDRLTRRVADMGALLEEFFMGDRYALLSVEDQVDTRTASGRLVLNILASVSMWEREAISERTRTVLKHKKSRGERTGNCPLGFRSEQTGALRIRAGVESRVAVLVADPREQEAIRCARELRASGLSFRAIAAELLSRGHPPRKGSRWWPTQVQRMLG